MAYPITREDLARMFPRALPDWLDALHEIGPDLAAFYDWNRLDWVHFCGQISAETDGLSLRSMRESMNFKTVKRIKEVYSYRLNLAIKEVNAGRKSQPSWVKGKTLDYVAGQLVNNPKDLADIVYGGREGTPWMQGAKYLGRGPTQITHLNNYREIGSEISRQPGGAAFDLVKAPELLESDPELGIRSAFADWHCKGLSRWAQKDDCDTLSDALNTGNIRDNVKPHGLDRRRLETNRARKIWPRNFTFDAEPAPVPAPAPQPPVVSAVTSSPSVPSDLSAKEVVLMSRKGRLIMRFQRFVHWVLGGFSFASVMEWLGYAKGVYNEVTGFVADNAIAFAICVALVALIMCSQILKWMAEDVEQGRYLPSGAQGAAGAGGDVAQKPAAVEA